MRFLPLLLPFLLGGCFMPESRPEKPNDGKPLLADTQTQSSLELYRDALEAERKGNFADAVKLHSLVAGKADSRLLVEASILSRARVLMNSGENQPALASLSPLSDNPKTLFESRKLAMAARILTRQQNYTTAESLYEVALDGVPKNPESERFRADGYAALGRIYLRNQKSEEAVKVMRKAEMLYRRNGLLREAEACKDLNDYLTEVR